MSKSSEYDKPKGSIPEGMITFAVSVRIDVTELRDWRPEQIVALFGGIAQVLATKDGDNWTCPNASAGTPVSHSF